MVFAMTPQRTTTLLAPAATSRAVPKAVHAGCSTPSRLAVQIRNASLTYPGGGSRALDDVSLDVAEGQFVSLVGPSGCGKTSLLNLCAGLVPHAGDGSIQVAGSAPELGSSQVAYMLARDSLLPWRTALDNACLGMELRGVAPKERTQRGRAMLAAVGLEDFGGHYPKQLSHGMRQRVALARTFALDSKILLMDEPFGALDAQTKLQLQDLLLGLCQKYRHTVLFVTHDLGEAVAVSDKVVIMSSRPGRIVAEVDVSLPRPRFIRELQKSSEYHELYSKLWSELEAGWSRHEG